MFVIRHAGSLKHYIADPTLIEQRAWTSCIADAYNFEFKADAEQQAQYIKGRGYSVVVILTFGVQRDL